MPGVYDYPIYKYCCYSSRTTPGVTLALQRSNTEEKHCSSYYSRKRDR